jgi:hypothetical protein
LRADPIGLNGGINSYAYANNDPILEIDDLGLKVKYSVHTIGGGAAEFAEGNIGFAYAESDCKNGKKYVAFYAAISGGINVGAQIKLGELLQFLRSLSKITSNECSLLGGDTFTIDEDVPRGNIFYLDVGAFQGGIFLTGSIIDIQIGSGRIPDDPMFNVGLTGNVGLSLSKAVGWYLMRIGMWEKDCCK